MRRLLLPLLLTACSSHTLTDTSASTEAPSALESRTAIRPAEHTVTGTGVQRIMPGLAYGTTVRVHTDGSGRISGGIRTHIIDLSAYGYPGQAEFDADATCMRVVGNTAWIGAITTRTSDPIAFPVGQLSVFWVRDGGASGPDVGHAGPAGVFDPTNAICTSTPPMLPPDPLTSGNFDVR